MNTDTNPPTSADEQSKQDIAKQVITQKRHYFFPQHSVGVFADTAEKAEQKLKAILQGAKGATKRKKPAKPIDPTEPVVETEVTTPEETDTEATNG